MTKYGLAMLTDKGWRFLNPDLYMLTVSPLEAMLFDDKVSAIKVANSIEDTEYYIEVIPIEITLDYHFPTHPLKRRET